MPLALYAKIEHNKKKLSNNGLKLKTCVNCITFETRYTKILRYTRNHMACYLNSALRWLCFIYKMFIHMNTRQDRFFLQFHLYVCWCWFIRVILSIWRYRSKLKRDDRARTTNKLAAFSADEPKIYVDFFV